MPAPTSYSESSLADFMHATLGNTAAELGWTVAGGSYTEAVNETVLAYGVSAIAAATDIRKLRALARREAWRAVVAQTAAEHDYAAGSSFNRSQINAQARAALALAEQHAAVYDDSYVISVSPVRRAHDPYIYLPDDQRPAP